MPPPEKLAIDGASPSRATPFPRWPHHEPDEIEAVTRVLASGRTNYWTGGECRLFEDEFARYHGRRHAIALMNGTAALELALIAFGIGPGDDVIVPSRTFIASASCVVARGGRPIVADIDPDSQNLTAATIRTALTPKTRAVVVVHLAGWPADMDAIAALAVEKNLIIIEDCAQAHGATWRGRPVGGFGHAAAFSFCQDKIMTTGGEGGMLLIDDEAAWARAWAYKDHGKNPAKATVPGNGYAFRWLHDSFGTNFRMTEMQAAIGRLQLQKLDAWLTRRRENAAILMQAITHLPGLRLPTVPPDIGHAFYKFYAFLRPEKLKPGWDQERILQAINAEGIPCISGSCSEIYREHAFVDAGFGPGRRLDTAARLGETSLCLQVHPTLTAADMHDMAAGIARVMTQATTAD